MSSARRRWAAAAVLVGVGWLVTPQPVAIYDGLGVPDEPYRFLVAPPGSVGTVPPTAGSAHAPVIAGHNKDAMFALTAEKGPQAELDLPPEALAATGKTIDIRITPMAPLDQPRDAVIVGNVYDVSISAGTGAVTLTSGAQTATIFLRVPVLKDPLPIMEHRASPSAPWRAVKTFRSGQDVFSAIFAGPGDYAMAYSRAPAPVHTSGLPLAVLLGIVLVVVLAGVVVVIRLKSKPR